MWIIYLLTYIVSVFPILGTSQAIQARITVTVTTTSGPQPVTVVGSSGAVSEVAPEQIWLGVVRVVMTCESSTCVWDTDPTKWAKFASKLDVKLANDADDEEAYGLVNPAYRERAFRKISVAASTVTINLNSVPGFVLHDTETVKLLSADLNFFFLQGVTSSDLTLFRVHSDDPGDGTEFGRRYRLLGTPYQTSFFSEKDIRLYGITLNISLLYDVFLPENIDFTQTLIIGYTDKSYPDADTAELTPMTGLDFRFHLLNPYTLSIMSDPNPTFNLIDASDKKKKTKYNFFVQIKQVFDQQPTFRGGVVSGRRRNNFTLWTMPNLKCA
eukprot:PhF_6_TR9711/c0_g1_i1/m.14946